MKIALVHEWLDSWGGAEEVLLALHELYPEAPIYTTVLRREKVMPLKAAKIVTSFIQKIPFAKYKKQLFFPLMPLAFEQFDLRQFDVIISSSYGAAKGVLTLPSQKHICYCHTPTRFLWEPHLDKRLPKGLIPKILASNLRVWDDMAAQRPDLFVANCKNIAIKIAKFYGRKSTVIYPPVDCKKYKVANPEEIKDYYLVTSRLVYQKRIDLIILAFRENGLKLKIVGSGPDESKLKELAKGSNNIEFLGFLPAAEKLKLLSECRAFVFMAEEDFGIAPIEAMASGRPVLAFDKGGVRESVISKKTGLLFSEQTPQSLMAAIDELKTIDFKPEEAVKQAKKFDKALFMEKIKTLVEGPIEGCSS